MFRTKTINLLVPLVIGILMYNYHFIPWLVLLLLSVILCIIISQNFKFRFHYRPLAFSFIIYSILVILGIMTARHSKIDYASNWYGNYVDSSQAAILHIQELSKSSDINRKYIANVYRIYKNGVWHRTIGRANLYVPNKISKLAPGQFVFTNGVHYKIKNPGNPHEFDYQSFINRNGIYGNFFIRDDTLYPLPAEDLGILDRIAFHSRNYAQDVINTYVDSLNRPLIEALTIGDRSHMDREQTNRFVLTGVVHLIALSGLHVGILWGFLMILFKPFKKKIPIVPIIIILLWLYAFIVGFNASIVRAVCLLSLWQLASYFGRSTQSINSLVFTAFLLLVFRPYWLFDIGFQLSFAATFSILLFFQPLNSMVQSGYSLIRKAWQYLAVTLSAQVFTLPIGLYYFHQFPNTFILSNTVAGAITWILVPLNTLLLMLGKIKIIGLIIGFVINILSYIMLAWVDWVSQFHIQSFSRLYIDLVQCIGLYIMIVLCYYAYHKEHKWYKFALILSALVYCLYSIELKKSKTNVNELVIYHLPRRTHFELVSYGNIYEFSSPNITEAMYNNNINTNHITHFISSENTHTSTLDTANNLIVRMKGYTLYYLRQRNKQHYQGEIDFLILSGNPKVSLEYLNRTLKINQVIVDGSNSLWKTERWKKQAEKLSLPFFATSDSGAYITFLTNK